MSRYELVGGPFDGTVLEFSMMVDSIALSTANIPLVDNPDLFIVYEDLTVNYSDDSITEEQLEKYSAWPLFFNGVNPEGSLFVEPL